MTVSGNECSGHLTSPSERVLGGVSVHTFKSIECSVRRVNREELVRNLNTEFDGSERALRAVSRQARDLADWGRIEEDAGYQPTPDDVVAHLQDAPDAQTLVERWNWWVGSLELAYGEEYRQFRVRPDIE